MEYGLIGEKLSHSFSKELHGYFCDYDYSLSEISENQLSDFFEKKDFSGINVTIPYKEKIIPYLDSLSDKAKKIGAVNTVFNKDGKLYGFNTDFGGMLFLFEKSGINPENKKVLILGTGGTSKTAEAVLKHLKAGRITKVSRTKKGGAVTYEYAENNLSDTDIIINCTPCGMYPENASSPINIDKFPSLSGVIDVIYNPINTCLLQKAKDKGIKAIGGLLMLVEQARLSSEIFTGKKTDESLSLKVYEKIKKEKQNIVLAGLPSSGKTVIGKKLAKALSRDFYDTDSEIEKIMGISIKEIFEKYGEDTFRKLEKDVISDISRLSGKVISTGGGAVLFEENAKALKQNGVIFLLQRPLCKLTPTSDRPLFDDVSKLRTLYDERKEKYLAAKDIIIETENSIDIAVSKIKEYFK